MIWQRQHVIVLLPSNFIWSIWAVRFRMFCRRMALSLQPSIGIGGSRLEVVSFGQSSQVIFDSSTLVSQSSFNIQAAIENMSFPNLGPSNSTSALVAVADQITRTTNTSVVQSVHQSVAIFTDGVHDIGSMSTKIASDTLKSLGCEVFTVGVSQNSSVSDMVSIASTPAQHHVFTTTSSSFESMAEVFCSTLKSGKL